jgi:hypothetical protein
MPGNAPERESRATLKMHFERQVTIENQQCFFNQRLSGPSHIYSCRIQDLLSLRCVPTSPFSLICRDATRQ